jgi:hypothetical protein
MFAVSNDHGFDAFILLRKHDPDATPNVEALRAAATQTINDFERDLATPITGPSENGHIEASKFGAPGTPTEGMLGNRAKPADTSPSNTADINDKNLS